MENKTIARTVQAGLCTSCGVCKGVCPRSCISWRQEAGQYLPEIDASDCVTCGLCLRVCPGISFDYPQVAPMDAITGGISKACNAWSRNPQMRHVSASGGVVSAMLNELLDSGTYDAAFCVDAYDYAQQLKTVLVDGEAIRAGKVGSLPKSRYLAVSHERTAAYMKENRDKRLILIGTSCAVRGLLRVIEQLKLDREQYLMIGLFCDQVFNYNVHAYFCREYAKDKVVAGIHFKNKESGGWPGNMKFLFEDGTSAYQDKSARMDAKRYFASERCQYCVDKLNVMADISLGDNYTQENSSPLGSNSVIIRTQRGENAWKQCASAVEAYPVDVEAIRQAQYLDGRLNNLYFSDLKQKELGRRGDDYEPINAGIIREHACDDYARALAARRRQLHAGAVYNQDPSQLGRLRRKENRNGGQSVLWSLAGRIYRKVKRAIKRG